MIGELAAAAKTAAIEVGKKAVDVSAFVGEKIKGVGPETEKKPVDITKRIDTTKTSVDDKAKGIDISKRIMPEVPKEMARTDVLGVARDYLQDLKTKSICSDSLSKSTIDISKLEVQSPDKVAKMRDEFDDKKADLRKEWETIHNREWPKYTENVYNESGQLIRKVGDNYDAHHITPLQLGGRNEASNLTPLDLREHNKLHSKDGSCNKLVEAVKGVE